MTECSPRSSTSLRGSRSFPHILSVKETCVTGAVKTKAVGIREPGVKLIPWNRAELLWWRRRILQAQSPQLWHLHQLWQNKWFFEYHYILAHFISFSSIDYYNQMWLEVILLAALSAYVLADRTVAPCSLQGRCCPRWNRNKRILLYNNNMWSHMSKRVICTVWFLDV